MGTAIKHHVPDQVKSWFVIFDIWALWCPLLSVRVSRCQKCKWQLNLVWHRMFYSCTHMVTVSVNGLRILHIYRPISKQSWADLSRVDRPLSGSPWPPKSVSVSARDGTGLPPPSPSPFWTRITSRSAAVSGQSSSSAGGGISTETFHTSDNQSSALNN